MDPFLKYIFLLKAYQIIIGAHKRAYVNISYAENVVRAARFFIFWLQIALP